MRAIYPLSVKWGLGIWGTLVAETDLPIIPGHSLTSTHGLHLIDNLYFFPPSSPTHQGSITALPCIRIRNGRLLRSLVLDGATIVQIRAAFSTEHAGKQQAEY